MVAVVRSSAVIAGKKSDSRVGGETSKMGRVGSAVVTANVGGTAVTAAVGGAGGNCRQAFTIIPAVRRMRIHIRLNIILILGEVSVSTNPLVIRNSDGSSTISFIFRPGYKWRWMYPAVTIILWRNVIPFRQKKPVLRSG